MFRSPLLAALLALMFVGVADANDAAANTAHDADRCARQVRRILFVGNSLSATNDLALMVKALAAADRTEEHAEPLAVVTVTFPNFSLDDHWQEGTARRQIRRGRWDVVVLQQGPSSLPESRRQLLAATARFSDLIRQHGAEPALLMVWPDASRLSVFDDVSRSHADAARAAEAVLIPAGDAWRAAWSEDPTLRLFGDDGFHPSRLGTYLAALVVHARLSGRSPAGLPATLRTVSGRLLVEAPPDRAALLQRAAARAAAQP